MKNKQTKSLIKILLFSIADPYTHQLKMRISLAHLLTFLFNIALIVAWHDITPPTPNSQILLVTMGGTKSHKIPFWALAKGLIAK